MRGIASLSNMGALYWPWTPPLVASCKLRPWSQAAKTAQHGVQQVCAALLTQRPNGGFDGFFRTHASHIYRNNLDIPHTLICRRSGADFSAEDLNST